MQMWFKRLPIISIPGARYFIKLGPRMNMKMQIGMKTGVNVVCFARSTG
jgi:hypothetical protein